MSDTISKAELKKVLDETKPKTKDQLIYSTVWYQALEELRRRLKLI